MAVHFYQKDNPGYTQYVRYVEHGKALDTCFHYDDYLKPDATTDRGWLYFPSLDDHPQHDDPGAKRQVELNPGLLCVGNWLDYEHDENHEQNGPTIHAVAYCTRFCPIGHTKTQLGSRWCWNIGEAKEWIAKTVAEHVSRQ